MKLCTLIVIGGLSLAPGAAPLSSSAVADAAEKLTGRRSHMTDEIRLLSGARLEGPAVTIRLVHDDKASVAEAGGAVIKALETASPGSVIVATLDDDKGYAVAGATFAALAKAKGLAGFVVDGSVRDIVDMRRLGVTVLARGTAPGSAGGHYRVDGVNVPVNAGGIELKPGDYVVADEDGVAVSPNGRQREVLALASTLQSDKQALVLLIAKHRSYLKALQAQAAAR